MCGGGGGQNSMAPLVDKPYSCICNDSLYNTHVPFPFSLRHDREGRYDRITYNNMVRDSVLGLPVDKVNALYKAMKAFDDMLHDYQSHIVYKMEPGRAGRLIMSFSLR